MAEHGPRYPRVKISNEAEASWARVELWRWQYGSLPGATDMRPLNVPAGLRAMAKALVDPQAPAQPTVENVAVALEYAAGLLEED